MVHAIDPASACAEQWRPVVGYESRYQVSSLGRIQDTIRGRIVSQRVESGYYRATLHLNGVRRNVKVHQVVAAAFIGPCPRGHSVDHADRNGLNNNPSNLRYTTFSQNNCNRVFENATGYRGVSKSGSGFRASIRLLNRDGGRGLRLHLGCYRTAEQAARSYDAAARAHHGAYAVTNFFNS